MANIAQEDSVAPLFESFKAVAHFLYAMLASIAALILIHIFQPIFHGNHAYWPLWPVIILAARFWGPGSASLAALVGWLGVWYWYIPPSNSFAVTDRSDWVGIISFLFVAGLIILSNLREQEMRRHVKATARTVSSTMRTLLNAYLEAVCHCKDRSHGHEISCPAHPSAPILVRAERSIRMLTALGDPDQRAVETGHS